MESEENGGPEPVGDPVCWLSRVCPECGSLAEGPVRPVCARCGAEMPESDDGR
ncbi:hypothetical protein LZG04_20365 [Saccharothrix sp. S26]|uniref:hypothetical protein n=1 Tax=Saccharothrix sp. S26 TaxID=2907215 RepID=UPI001F42E02B|nr:hypothetical protein [Saccharothrix sp. S26]MCE6997138.1 hypothetical protein [Saccharothrix sp. S26]